MGKPGMHIVDFEGFKRRLKEGTRSSTPIGLSALIGAGFCLQVRYRLPLTNQRLKPGSARIEKSGVEGWMHGVNMHSFISPRCITCH